eukprot:11012-Pelagomonas_calceolata.AAC.2
MGQEGKGEQGALHFMSGHPYSTQRNQARSGKESSPRKGLTMGIEDSQCGAEQEFTNARGDQACLLPTTRIEITKNKIKPTMQSIAYAHSTLSVRLHLMRMAKAELCMQ